MVFLFELCSLVVVVVAVAACKLEHEEVEEDNIDREAFDKDGGTSYNLP